jgi:hypothetical protein
MSDVYDHAMPADRSYESMSQLLKETRRLGGAFVENPDFAVEGFARSANTFLVTALNVSWPDMVVRSHSHQSSFLRAADGQFPVVSVLRNPLDAIASYSVHQSVQDPDRARDLASLMDEYGDVVSSAAGNPNVFILPFEKVVFDIAGTLDLLETKYGLTNRVYVSPDVIFSQTTDLSKRANKSEELFAKKGHVPRSKDPRYAEVLAELQGPPCEKALHDLTRMYDGLVHNYYKSVGESFPFAESTT